MAGSFSTHARQHGKLALTHGETGSTFAHVGVQAVGQVVNPFAAGDLAGRCRNLFISGFRAAVADILAQRAGEQKRLLGHHAHLAAILRQVERADITASINTSPP